MESGLITLIGATTENPSFEVIAPLLSRCRVIILKPLSSEDIAAILKNALEDKERGLGNLNLALDEDIVVHVSKMADGDARSALNSLETAAFLMESRDAQSGEASCHITLKDIMQAIERKPLLYDKSGEEHYNLISAFHKSLRGSDPDAAAYWLARMLSAGEDPLYIARRMVRFASEDIGNADPRALELALSAMEAFRFLGHPEGELALVHAAVYLATAPKSNSIYAAHGAVKAAILQHGALPVPLHIRNAPTSLMKEIGYGKGYKYAHDYPNAYAPQDYLPEKLKGRHFYEPTDRGYENHIRKLLEKWRDLKQQKENTKKISE